MENEKEEILKRLKALALTRNLDENQHQKMMKLVNKPLLTTGDLAIIFQNTPKTIARWRNAGKIEFVMIGRSYYYLWEEILRKLQNRNR